MFLSRNFSPALRSGLVLGAGAVMIIAPLAFGLSPAAAATGLAVGVLTIALALAGTADSGRGTLPISTQAAYDAGLGVGLLLGALAFGIAGQLGPLVLFGAVGLVILAITSTTRNSVRPTQDFL
jgi:hypothetical protein